MIFAWLKNRRRRKLLAQPFPAAWLEFLHNNVAHYRYLSGAEQAKLRDELRIFVADKNWEGCGGLAMTDEMKVTIAAQACLLVLGMRHNYFDRVLSILVYPHGYRDPMDGFGGDGLVHRGQARLGESWYRGPVVLAWDHVRFEGQHPSGGKNVVFHEFAHQLDMLDGIINGTPPLGSPEESRRWAEVMTAEYKQLQSASEHGQATLLDQYGTTNEGEFFAVATECFFDRPVALRQRYPRLYELLRDYYRQDPARRVMDQPVR
jgi:Mlc titration factor MtfA (ptsG expression regulator)